MVQRLRDWLMIALLCLGCALVGLAIVSLMDLRDWMKQQAPTANEMLDHLDSTLATADVIATDSEKPVRLILKHADEAMGETARTMKHVAAVTSDIGKEQAAASIETMTVLAKTADAMVTLDDQIERVGEQARLTLSGAEIAEHSLKLTIDDLGRQVNSPYIGQTFQNLAGITESWDTLSADTLKIERKYFFPTPYAGRHKILHRIGAGAFGTIKTALPFTEFYYNLTK